MPELNVDIPAFKTWVRKEFLHNHESGKGEFERCLVFAVRSVPNRAIGFRVLLESGAQYEGIPIHALCWSQDAPEASLYVQEMWDCFGLNVVCNVYAVLEGTTASIYLQDNTWAKGRYMFSLDWHSDPTSDLPDERGDAHIFSMENGLYCAYANNRICWRDGTFTIPFADKEEKPTYRANSVVYSCEIDVPSELKKPLSVRKADQDQESSQ